MNAAVAATTGMSSRRQHANTATESTPPEKSTPTGARAPRAGGPRRGFHGGDEPRREFPSRLEHPLVLLLDTVRGETQGKLERTRGSILCGNFDVVPGLDGESQRRRRVDARRGGEGGVCRAFPRGGVARTQRRGVRVHAYDVSRVVVFPPVRRGRPLAPRVRGGREEPVAEVLALDDAVAHRRGELERATRW